MEEEHREAIRRNISSLVNQTDLEIMRSALYEKRILTEHNMDTYLDCSSTPMHRKRCMYNDIMRRGPRAFDVLLETLEENGYWELVRMLDPNSILNAASSANSGPRSAVVKENFLSISTKKKSGSELLNNHPPPENGTRPAPAPPTANALNNNDIEPLVVTKSTKFVDDNPINHELGVYHTRGKQRGVLVMFTYMSFHHKVEEYRAGAEVDCTRLKHLFGDVGFKVLSYLNLTYQETTETLEDLKGVLEPAPESVFVVVSSHGYERPDSTDNDIRCSDGKLIALREILSYFSNRRLPHLRDVPKVFVFQICRGNNEDYVNYSPPPPHLTLPAAVTDGTPVPPDSQAPARLPARTSFNKTMALYTNILVVQATLPGLVSRRDPTKGSWYIQAMCAVFAERAHDCDVDTLFTLVDERLKETFHIQTSSVDRWGFNRRLYLHPGLFE